MPYTSNPSPANLTPGGNGLPKVVLSAPDGARAEIYLHGAHVTSWVPAAGNEQLFLSQTSEFSPQTAIRGGVPVIFPQFSGMGPLPKHGFARRMDWEFIEAGLQAAAARAVFRLKDTLATRSAWPYAFSAELEVAVGGQDLALTLSVFNRDSSAFTFSAALHTYLAVTDISGVRITGLGGKRYIDSTRSGAEGAQEGAELAFDGEVDRVYPGVSAKLSLVEGEHRVVIEGRGFPDVVVWNPWREVGAALADLEPEGYRRMVCIEAAIASRPVSLEPSEHWSGSQRLHTGETPD